MSTVESYQPSLLERWTPELDKNAEIFWFPYFDPVEFRFIPKSLRVSWWFSNKLHWQNTQLFDKEDKCHAWCTEMNRHILESKNKFI